MLEIASCDGPLAGFRARLLGCFDSGMLRAACDFARK